MDFVNFKSSIIGGALILGVSLLFPVTSSANKTVSAEVQSPVTTFSAISKQQWPEYLSGKRKVLNSDWLNQKADKYAVESTTLLNSGDIVKGLNKSIVSSVIREYLFELIGDVDNPSYKASRVAYLQNRAALLRAGVNQHVFSESLGNLKTVLPRGEIALNKPKDSRDVKVSRPSSADRAKLIAAVKKVLIDPYSAKFEDIVVIGNKSSCVIVNSKNRFGAYAGKKAFYVEKESSTWGIAIDVQTQLNCVMYAQKQALK